MNNYVKSILITAVLFVFTSSHAQDNSFIFGADLSYVNQMEDCGAVYKEKGELKDVFHIFADHGFNLVRVRLWVDPSWWQNPIKQPEGVKPCYSNLADVEKTIRRAKEAGMQVMLGFHYSDFWADPARQLVPHRWLSVAHNIDALADSMYQYTLDVLTYLDQKGLMPEYVKIGNENNSGIVNHIAADNDYQPVETISGSWDRHAVLYNAAIKAVREAGARSSIQPKIAVHFAGELTAHHWFLSNLIDHGVTDFDVYGFSYYYAWHKGSIPELETAVRELTASHPGYEVMVVETGYPWSTENYDSLMNIVVTPDSAYLPVCPEKQLEYMVDYTHAVMSGGGTGVIFWEPAWVTTPCRTPWGQGSSHDHLAFFDPVDCNFMENGAGMWPLEVLKKKSGAGE